MDSENCHVPSEVSQLPNHDRYAFRLAMSTGTGHPDDLEKRCFTLHRTCFFDILLANKLIPNANEQKT